MGFKIVVWGLGAMGSGMARLITEKRGLELVGGIDRDQNKKGKDLGKILGGESLGIKVENDFNYTFKDADLVIIATTSFTREVFPQIERAVNNGLNVITIAEEMAYPEAQEAELADKIDKLARENGVTVLGTGVNPGFVLDTLVVTLSAVSCKINKIKATRVNDLSPFGPTVMKTQGVGTTPEEFKEGVEKGEITGHIGFPESIRMIADTIGWDLDEIKEKREPIISNTHRETPYIKVEPGMVAGCNHIAWGLKDGKKIIELEHPQQICPEKEGVETGDYIEISGDPDLKLRIKPEIPGGKGTQAVAVNMIPAVIEARPGLVSMMDLPVPRYIK
ncbi:2,4-diaminopentanoate dehydrogenase [Halothermothrix orenii]|uniref:Dihydrodipicolinate reductase n=1 Tax=Halothermothrix orenii (strain H 168 / OCM 544 / DSM 9562) TaxID=373903 RepID=B8D005_HALOH|nr:2,4-diaminopentanoate dehydrogenase [Halothermothrix orenii]ACL70857.1 dihydrodipicolinate reductase [Halothermothrix orenii H 168]